MQLLVTFARAQDPSLLPGRVRTDLGVGKDMWLAWSNHSGDATPPGMSVDHAQRIAIYIGQPTSSVLRAAGLRSEADLLFDGTELQAAVERAGDEARQEVGRHLLALVTTLPESDSWQSADGAAAPLAKDAEQAVAADPVALADWLKQALATLGFHPAPAAVVSTD
jgi:hypothetical protein